MKLTTTLKLLRENKACVDGYNKVVCALKGIEYEERNSYIRFRHDEEINLLSILDSNGVNDCVWALRATVQNSDKISRLLAVAFAREVQHLMKDERSIRALDVAERYANGEATVDELYVAWNAAWEAAWEAALAARDAAWYAALAARDAVLAASQAAALAARAAAQAAAHAAQNAAQNAAWYAACHAQNAAKDAQSAAQKKQREIIKSFLSEN